MQLPIINGVYTDEGSDFRVAYPKNLIPVPVQQGISNGYLRPADGIVGFSPVPPGADRGGFEWNGVCYRVSGTKLISVDANGIVTEHGTVTGAGQVTFDYSFDYLSITADNKLYLWNGTLLQQVTDPDLGNAVDHIWVDGYFMTTDGEFLVVTQLNDPFDVNPTKYGSSEADPDPVKALLKLRNEPYALNRYTIEAFDNIGGTGFPFQRIDGAQIQRGVIGTHACCVFLENIAFLGGGRNEAIAVWLGANGQTVKISTREIDLLLEQHNDADLANVVMEARVDKSHLHLFIHLSNQTLVYDAAASEVVGESIWFTLSSSLVGLERFKARNFVRCYNKWIVGDPQAPRLGYFSSSIGSHWGDEIEWEFSTVIVYNEGRGAIFHELELVALTGRQTLGVNSTIWTRYSFDGESWSQVKPIRTGVKGDRTKRLVWLNQGPMEHWRIQQFRGTSGGRLSFARLEARLEGLLE